LNIIENIIQMSEHNTQIYSAIYTALSKSEGNVFEHIEEIFQTEFHKPSSSMIELRRKTEKSKGDLFESFCVLYLQKKGYTCWKLKDLPDDIRESLHLTKQDVGIDLIAKCTSNHKKEEDRIDLWFPVQVKFRSESKDNQGRTIRRVTWRDISTFLSLCTRTGPENGWSRHMIFTNANSVCWKGKKNKKDYTIARATLTSQDKIFWSSFINKKEYDTRPNSQLKKETINNLRENWLNRISKTEK
jgi:hypothetical protein